MYREFIFIIGKMDSKIITSKGSSIFKIEFVGLDEGERRRAAYKFHLCFFSFEMVVRTEGSISCFKRRSSQ